MTRPPASERAHFGHWTSIDTRWSDNDVYGHVNNVVFYSWFDTAVNRWLISEGLLDPIMGDPIGLVVETGCRYATPISFPSVVEIGLAVTHIGTSSVEYGLGAFKPDEARAAAQGRFVHVCVARETRRPTALPQRWRSAFEKIMTREKM